MKQGVKRSVVENRPVSAATAAAVPKRIVRPVDAFALIVGIVVGAGIFRTPSFVAGNAASVNAVYLAWILGGVMSLVGAIVYAELATTYPQAGGDYYYLRRAYGDRLAFLFGWARMTVIQTGSIAFLSFAFGDYVTQVLSLGKYSPAIYAALCVVVLTALNVKGVREGTRTQNLLAVLQALGIIMVIAAGFVAFSSSAQAPGAPPAASSTFSRMMIFVLLTYGGWNEAAYVAGELRDVQRNMARVLIISVLAITAIYVGMNWAYLHGLGLTGVAGSQQVAADLMRRGFGQAGAWIISLLVAVAVLTSANASVFTGGRSSYALGCDFRQFGFLGRWSARTGTPVNGLLVQGCIAMALVIFGVFARRGFETMVDYTAPVFWFFFLLTGFAFFILRRKDASIARPFRVPLYPIVPAVFIAICGYLLYSSLDYNRVGALAGVAVLGVGAVLLFFVDKSRV